MSTSLFGRIAKKAAAIENQMKEFDTKVQKLQNNTVKYVDKIDNVSKVIERKVTKK